MSEESYSYYYDYEDWESDADGRLDGVKLQKMGGGKKSKSGGKVAPSSSSNEKVGSGLLKPKRSSSLRARLRGLTAADKKGSMRALVEGEIGPPAAGAEYHADSLYDLYPANYKHFVELGGIPGVAAGIGADTSRGIDSGSADRRKETYGPNKLPDPPTKTFLDLCIATVMDFTLLLLIAAAGVSLLLGLAFDDDSGDSESEDNAPPWVEGTAILIAVIIVVLVTAINDFKREKQFQELNKIKDDRSVTVLRADSGEPQSISIYDVVVGDLLLLSTGDIVPVDGLYVDGASCSTDESGQTGEPDLVHKSREAPFLISGSKVQEGSARILVTGVGENSHNGRAVMALRVPPVDTPLQVQLGYLAGAIGKAGVAVSILLFVVLTIKFFIQKVDKEEKFGTASTLDRITSFVTTGVTVAVVAVPEGLPLAVTISLAYAMLRMFKQKNLVRTLAACETMGRATVICSDKTGTLTANKMTVVDGMVGSFALDDVDKADASRLSKMANNAFLVPLLESIQLNSAAAEVKNSDGVLEWSGSTTEMAMLNFARDLRKAASSGSSLPTYSDARKGMRDGTYGVTKVKVFPFSSKRKRSSIAVQREDGRYRLYVKGASEKVLAECVDILNDDGSTEAMTEGRHEEYSARIAAMADDALRTLAIGFKDYDSMPLDEFEEEDISELTLLGLIGIRDVIREAVPGAVRDVQRAGVVVRMVTGDNLATAKAIGIKCNIFDPENDIAMEGPDFAKTTNAELRTILPSMTILARSSPLDKQRLVDRLQTDFGEIVAVTGDGTNDGPALSKADIGFGMGITGTEVAKAASDIILLDDNFASIVVALMWGRSVYDAIRKFLIFQLTVNVVAVVVAFVGAVADEEGESPIKAVGLLFVNLIMDSLGALALSTEPPSKEVLLRMPTRFTDSLISPVMWVNIGGQAIFQLVLVLWLLFDGFDLFDLKEGSLAHHSLVFNTFVMLQLFNEVNAHAYGHKASNPLVPLTSIIHNRLFLVIWVICFLGQVFLIEVAGDFASTTGQTFGQWMFALGIGFLSIPMGVLLRFVPVEDPETYRENVNELRLR